MFECTGGPAVQGNRGRKRGKCRGKKTAYDVPDVGEEGGGRKISKERWRGLVSGAKSAGGKGQRWVSTGDVLRNAGQRAG